MLLGREEFDGTATGEAQLVVDFAAAFRVEADGFGAGHLTVLDAVAEEDRVDGEAFECGVDHGSITWI